MNFEKQFAEFMDDKTTKEMVTIIKSLGVPEPSIKSILFSSFQSGAIAALKEQCKRVEGETA